MVKKYLPYGLLLFAVIAFLFLLFTRDNKRAKQFDDRVTFRKRDKLPYGTFVAFDHLKYLFPGVSIVSEKKAPGYWDSLYVTDDHQALVVISPRFYADEEDMKTLTEFVANGNDVFVSAIVISEDAKEALKCGTSFFNLAALFAAHEVRSDSLWTYLDTPPFKKRLKFTYPGEHFDSHFFKVDSSTTTVLGRGGDGPNFIHLKAGKGNFYMHLSPFAFSNYFLLHKENMKYYEQVLSVLSPSTEKILWDEYYLNRRYEYERDEGGAPGWFKALMSYEGLNWALLTAVLTLLAYVIFEMRRKQRYIPAYSKPANDSLDFVKTIGRLYFDKGDHKNIASKMAAHFREHVNARYKIQGANMDDDFINKLHFKTGYDERELREIVYFIRELDNQAFINAKELTRFYKKLESFYERA